ncbi:hypothetical protein BGZ83_002617 [Gryganskiella cystojenkinii]|nr:hypothetical protein BGZ83_002617 [Gryganskiella cystojenkinii]
MISHRKEPGNGSSKSHSPPVKAKKDNRRVVTRAQASRPSTLATCSTSSSLPQDKGKRKRMTDDDGHDYLVQAKLEGIRQQKGPKAIAPPATKSGTSSNNTSTQSTISFKKTKPGSPRKSAPGIKKVGITTMHAAAVCELCQGKGHEAINCEILVVDDVEDLDIVEVHDDDEADDEDDEDDEPLIRTRHYQVESARNNDKASHKRIEQEQTLVSTIDEGFMDIDNGAQNEVAKTPSGRHKGKGKAPVLPNSSESPLESSSLSTLSLTEASSLSTWAMTSFRLLSPHLLLGRQPASFSDRQLQLMVIHLMKLAIINEFIKQDTMTAEKMLLLDQRVTRTLDDLNERKDTVLQAIEKAAEEIKTKTDVCLAQLKYFRERLVALEKAEKDQQSILTQIFEL